MFFSFSEAGNTKRVEYTIGDSVHFDGKIFTEEVIKQEIDFRTSLCIMSHNNYEPKKRRHRL